MRKVVRVSVILFSVLMFLMSGANAIALMDEIPIDQGTIFVGDIHRPLIPSQQPQGVRVKVNGKFLVFDVPPYINQKTNRTMIPVRAVAEALNCSVTWDGSNKTAIAERNDTIIYMKVGEKKGIINGTAIQLDAPVELTSGRTLVPLRFIAENFGAKVSWDGNTRTVDINYN